MGGPSWLSGIFAAVMLTVAVYCSGRLLAARWWRRPTELDTDGAHVVMGVAMAGMLVPGLHTLPANLWEGVFAVGAAWFCGQLLRGRRRPARSPWRCLHAAPHLVECAAMLYMFLLLPASAAIRSTAAGMAAMPLPPNLSRFSFLALLMALFLLGYVVWLGDRLTLRAPALALAGQPAFGPPTPAPAATSPPAPPAPVADTAAPVASAPVASAPVAPAPAGADPGPSHRYLAPRCAVLCKIAMGITMGYMLVLML